MANTNDSKQNKNQPQAKQAPKVDPKPKVEPKVEVKQEVKETAPKVEPKVEVKPKPEPKPTVAPKVEAKDVLEVTESDSINIKHLKGFLTEYLEEMRPGKTHANDSGSIMQVRLYRTIQSIFRLEGQEFFSAYELLLKVVKDNLKGCFSDRYYARYFDTFNLSKTDARNFARVMNMLIVTCDLSKVKLSLKQVDVGKTLEGFNNPQLEQLVQGFYNR